MSTTAWEHGEKRGDINVTPSLSFSLGRWDFGLTRQYTGDRYGRIGADSWRWSLIVVRNPR